VSDLHFDNGSQDRRDGDEPMSSVEKIIFGLRLSMLLAVVAGLVWSGFYLYRKYDVPVAVIGVDGELKKVSANDVEAIVANNLGGGFLSLDLEGICTALEEHPWVASASARRKWPDEVVITLEEEIAIARWGKSDFLNNKGQILDVGAVELPQSLPLLDGPEGFERRVMQQYRNFSQVLQDTGLDVAEFRLAPRGNWEVKFAPGLLLVVGKEPVAAKLQRFLKVWDKSLHDRVDSVERVDIRYGNGVAVRWKNDSEDPLGESDKSRQNVKS
jgi:cell division protein FtsQ